MRDKIEALENIYSLFEQNIKSCNAKRWQATSVWKTAIGLISKKATLLREAHFLCTFLCRCSARLQRETFRNFLVTRSISYVFSFTSFHCRSFSPCVGAASISHFVTAATKFSCCSSNKKMSPVFFLSLSRSLSPFFSLSFARLPLFLFFSVFLLLYIPNLWTWQLI